VDKGRESRWDKDAVTVEIVFALVTAGLLAAAVYAVALVPVLACGVSGAARHRAMAAGAGASAIAGVWRLVRVLRRFDARRRQGN
jgi:hypothetical protein